MKRKEGKNSKSTNVINEVYLLRVLVETHPIQRSRKVKERRFRTSFSSNFIRGGGGGQQHELIKRLTLSFKCNNEIYCIQEVCYEIRKCESNIIAGRTKL